MRNFEGVIATYSEPLDYHRHQAENCQYCRHAAPKEGIAKLLAGDAVVLEPEGLRRKQRRTKRLDADRKQRRKTPIQLPLKQLQPAGELIPLEAMVTVTRGPARPRSNGKSRPEN